MSATAVRTKADIETAPIACSSSKPLKSFTPSSLKRARSRSRSTTNTPTTRSRSATNTPSSSKSWSNANVLKVIPPDEYYDQTETSSSSKSSSLPKTPETPSTSQNPKNPEGDSGHGDFEDDIPLSSISSPSFSFPDGGTSLFDSESEETESLCSCSNSCCSGSYTRSESCSRSGSGSISDTETETDTVNTRTLSKSYRAYLRRIQKLKKTLENWDRFLSDNGISRPDFFCRYKERESLQQIVDEFHEVTNRHREGFLGAIRDAKLRERQRRNSCRNRKIRKVLIGGSRANSSRDSGNDASSSNEAAHLQQRLKNLSSELVTLRNRLHVNGQPPNGTTPHHSAGTTNNSPPHVPPHVIPLNANNVSNSLPPIRTSHHQLLGGHGGGAILPPGPNNNNSNHGMGYPNKPLPPHPPSHHNNNNNNILHTNNNNNNNHNLNSHHLNNNTSIVSGNHNSHSNTVNNNNNLNNHHHHNNNSTNSASNAYYVNQHFPKDVMRGGNCGGALENGKLVVGSGGGSAGSVIGTTATTTSGEDATPSESSYKLSTKSAPTTLLTSTTTTSNAHRRLRLADIEDLIHLSGPLTEDALIRCLQARCAAAKYYAYMGPILLMANPLSGVGNPLTLSSTKTISAPPPVQKIVQEALRQQGDTGYPQAIILSGCSGSGKTYTSMLVLRQLFELAGGGMETDAYKHLAASITVLRSLGTARTASNTESSRIGHFIEVQVTDGTVYRTKVHCYFLDQSRVVSTASDEKNYHIFYQMLAGLSAEERSKLHLRDHRVETLRYLNSADPRTDEAEDARRFLEWKASLGVLGIPFLDVVRVLTAVILIGNVQFVESASCMEMEVEGETELQAAANLLGVSETALKQGLTTRTHNVRNQFVRSRCDANMSNFTRDALAKSLYCRTVATIVRRANSLKRLGSTSGTLSSDSTDSVHNQAEVASQHASTVGTAGSKASKSMTALNNAVRHATDGFIGILDMFGFEDVKPSHLEHLCVNLCAETMQHFYNTHIFKACIESCRDEGIQCDWEVDYVDNVPCIDLISSLRTGLLSMLDVECSVRGTVESYIQKVRSQHKTNPRLLESKSSTDLRSFAIQHYAGKVTYDATEFLETNRDVLADDLVAVFHKHRCSFGFASHLFSSELKILGAGGMEPSPRGISFRISPTSHTELLNGDEPVSTLTQDFHTRLDNLLRTLVHARPHFIRCIKINHNEQQDLFDRHTVSKQIRAFQVLETVNLMANGYPHRMRFKAFNARYKLIAPFHQLSRTDDRATEDCQLILECFDNSLDSCVRERLGHISISWALGKRHIFLSEGARQQLEALRTSTRNRAATIVQSVWRGWHCRQRWPIVRQGFHLRFQHLPPPVPPPNSVSNTCGLLATATAIHPVTISTATTNSMNNQHGNTAPNNNLSHSNVAINSHTMNLRNNSNANTSAPSATSNTSIFHMQMMSGSQAQQAAAAAVAVASMAAMLGGSMSPNIPNVPIPAPRTSTTTNLHLLPSNNGPSNNLPNIIPGTNATTTIIPNTNGSPSISSSCNSNTGGRPRPQPIAGTPPPDAMDRCDPKLVQQTCNMFGLDMERPPPLPPSRSYTVAGNTKLGYPQTRVMKMTFPDEGTTAEIRLLKGDTVMVVGASPRRGHLMVEHKNRTIHVPFQYLELKAPQD